MISIEAYSELLQVLYSAPLDREQWQRFLTLVSDYTRSNSGVFLSVNDHLQLSALATGGAFSASILVQSYNQEHAQSDPFRTAVAHQARTRDPVGVYSENELLPNDGLLQTSLYRDLLMKDRLRYAAITVLSASVRRLDAFSLWRTVDEGSIDNDSRRLLELLLPHVQVALEINRRLKISEQGRSGNAILADASPSAVFILDVQATVYHCNAAAESMVRAGDGLKVKNGKLIAGNASLTTALHGLIRNVSIACLTIPSACTLRALALPRSQGKRPLQLMASPLQESQRGSSGGDVLLVATDPDATTTFPDDLLYAMYRFTSAEVEVANGLMTGYSTDEIASLRRVSIGTVRQQIKSMLVKTGTSRQSDMVRLFMTLPVPVARNG